MATHNDLGREGETLAARYLQDNGYTLLHQNWRHSYFEIDIIAIKENILHFVEVKMRSSNAFGLPEEGVTKKKFGKLLKAADEFLYHHPQYRHVQYDILAITKTGGGEVAYFFIEDIYL